jgi:two-component system response regulator DegU
VNEKIKVVVADDHAMFRQGIISLLKFDSGIMVVGEAANGRELLKILNSKRADIILLDIQMPVMNGTQALEVLKQRFPDHGVIMVSMEFNAFMLEEYFKQGAHGFIPKGCDIDVLIGAIYQVKEEGHCHDLSFKLVNQLNKHSLKPFKNSFILSPREIEVLSLTCRGNSNKEMASVLRITERTVEFHKTNIYLKTGLKSLSDLIAYGIRNGLDIL